MQSSLCRLSVACEPQKVTLDVVHRGVLHGSATMLPKTLSMVMQLLRQDEQCHDSSAEEAGLLG